MVHFNSDKDGVADTARKFYNITPDDNILQSAQALYASDGTGDIVIIDGDDNSITLTINATADTRPIGLVPKKIMATGTTFTGRIIGVE